MNYLRTVIINCDQLVIIGILLRKQLLENHINIDLKKDIVVAIGG